MVFKRIVIILPSFCSISFRDLCLLDQEHQALWKISTGWPTQSLRTYNSSPFSPYVALLNLHRDTDIIMWTITSIKYPKESLRKKGWLYLWRSSLPSSLPCFILIPKLCVSINLKNLIFIFHWFLHFHFKYQWYMTFSFWDTYNIFLKHIVYSS